MTDLTFEPIIGLRNTYEVCAGPERLVLGVIVENDDDDWRVLSTRHGHPEPVRGRHATREAAAATLTTGKGDPE